MSYLVLARKYRPALFADIIGQQHIVQTLENAMRLNRLHHAFLLTGARGVGKTTTARVLARAMNCTQERHGLDACLQCASCLDLTSGAAADVTEIDAASHTGVDSVRELRDNLRYMPTVGKYRIYIIDEVHMLSTAAFNALLKTLEEPPAHVKFIFATTEPHKIPTTILSRCMRFDFRRVSITQLSQHLAHILAQENIQANRDALMYVAREAQGSVRDALSLLEQVLSFAGHTQITLEDTVAALGGIDRSFIVQLANALLRKQKANVIQFVEQYDLRGLDFSEAASLLAEYLRDLMIVHVNDPGSLETLSRSEAELQSLREHVELVSRTDMHRLFKEILALADDVARSSMPRISFEMGLLRALDMAFALDLETLLQKIDTLQKSISVQASTVAEPIQQTAIQQKTLPIQPMSKTVNTSSVQATPALSWQELVVRVGKVRPALASVLEHARVIQCNLEGVIIAFASSSFYFTTACEPDHKSCVESILNELGCGQTPFRIQAAELQTSSVPNTAASMTLAQQREHEHQQAQTQLREQVLAHPSVQGAVQILGAQVHTIQSLKE